MKSYPVKPDELSTRWLSEVLGFAVGGFEVKYFSEGAGVMALVTRVELESANGNPDSVIVKFPSPSADNRGVAHTYNMYGREVQFYQTIANSVSVRTPACYFGAFDPADHEFVLVLEDLGDLRIGDQVAGCTLAEARAVISAIARLHADGWQTEQFADLISHNNPMQRDGMIGGWQLGWPVVLEQFADLVPAAARASGDNMPDAIAGLLDDMCQDPVCLTHADVRLDNVFFGAGNGNGHGDGEIALVDWQSICTSAPEQDLAYFLTQSVPPEVLAQEDLVAFYHTELTKRGIDYSLDRCRERYRVCALYLLCYAVVIAGTLDLANERGAELGRTLLGNSFKALDEMDAFALLN
jgi:hypothetical protein